MFEVTRHPFLRFEESPLGESTRAVFGADDRVQVDAMDPGGSVEPGSGIDAAVRTTPTLYFRGATPQWSAHDEWTVSGVHSQHDYVEFLERVRQERGTPWQE